MGISDALEELGRYLDRCEDRVQRVELLEGAGSGENGALTADLAVTLPVGEGGIDGETVEASPVAITDDGAIRVTFESSAGIVPATNDRVTVESRDVTVTDRGDLSVTLSVSVPTDRSSPPVRSNGKTAGTGVESLARTDTAPVRSGTSDDSRLDVERDDVGNVRGLRSDSDDAASMTHDATDDRERTDDRRKTDGRERTDDRRQTDDRERTDDRRQTDGREQTNADAESEPPSSTSDRDVPPFEDRELLEEVYESCDTFAEMPEAIGMDVTAETVRRYMIDHGIHKPNSYNTTRTGDRSDDDESESDGDRSADSDEDRPTDVDDEPLTVVADGIGLPEDVTIDAIIDTVSRSNTIYEVQRDIGVGRREALDMLRELNLLDLVVGRLATEGDRRISREEVIDRLRTQDEVATPRAG